MLQIHQLRRCMRNRNFGRLYKALAVEGFLIGTIGTKQPRAKWLSGAGTSRLYASEAVARQEEPIIARIRTNQLNSTPRQTETTVTSTLSKTTKTRQRRSKAESKDTAEQKTAKETTTKPIKSRKKASEKEKTAALSKEQNTVEQKIAEETVTKTTKSRKKASEKEKTTALSKEAGEAPAKTKRTRKASKTALVAEQPSNSSNAPAAPVLTQLRPYQQECIDACLSNLKKGIMRQIVSLPVGSGKTVIFSHMMKNVPAPFPGANKTLILAHRQELLEQTCAHILRNGTGLTVSVDQGSRNADMRADVIVASVPTLGRVGTTRLLKYNPKEFKCIIIDEAHHAAAESYGRILEHFGAHVPDTHIFVYGCSATVRRHDGLKLGHLFDHISFHKSFITMIEDKWLCGLRVSTIQTDFDLRDVRMQGGDFAQKDLAVKVNTDIRNDIVVRSYMTYCADRKSTVVFAVDIEHLETLAALFRKYGYDARGLSSRTSDEDRAQLLKDFRERKFPVIVNCGILTEGTDIPAIDSIIMARPTKSNVLFQQMLGRGMRLYPGKEDCLVLDFVDIVKGEGLITLPTLLGLDASAILGETAAIKSQEDVNALLDQEINGIEASGPDAQYPNETEEEEETIDPLTGVKVARIRVLEYENPYQLLEDCSGIPNRLWDMSSNAWVNVGVDMFALTFQDVTFKIEKSSTDGLYRCLKRITLDRKKKTMPDASVKSFRGGVLTFQNNHAAAAAARKKQREEGGDDSRFIKSKGTLLPIESDSLRDCIHGVDTWIAKNIGHFPELIGRHAKWRKLPASDSQMKFLRKLGYDNHASVEDDADEQSADKSLIQRKREAASKPLTKGQAANMITRLVNGAGKHWEESKKIRIKRAKEMAKEIGLDIGPIPKYVNV